MRLKRSLATLMIMVLVLGCIPMETYAQGNNQGYDRENAIRLDYNGLSFITTNERTYYWFELVAGVSDKNYTINFERITDEGSTKPVDAGETPYITDAKIFDAAGNELLATCEPGETTVLKPTDKLEKNKVYYIQAFFNSNAQDIYMTIPGERYIRPTKSWEITYNLNGGTGTAPVDSEWYFGSDTLAYHNVYSPDNDPTAPAQGSMVAPAGATFAGWKDESGKAYAAGDKIASTTNVTLYAQWTMPSSSADANSTVYTVDDVNHTVAGGSSSITTVATVQQVLANMTFSEKASYKIVSSGQDLSSVSNAASATAKAGTDRIVSGDQLVVIAENGINYAAYTITATDPPTAPTIGTLAISGDFTAGKSITLGDLTKYIPTVTANSATITAQGWQASVTSGGGSGSWTTLTVGGVLPVDTSTTFKLRYYVTYDGTTMTSNEVTLNVVGNATTLALAASPASPQSTGTPITLTATLTGFFVGPGVKDQTITFKNGSEILSTAALNDAGVATYTWTPDSVGTYSLTAEYAASSYNTAATSNTVSWQSTGPSDWNGVIPESNSGYTYSGGSGTQASPYLISNSYDLAMLASNVNTVGYYSVGKYFKMTADIDLNPGVTVTDANVTPKEWTPIGGFNRIQLNGVNTISKFNGTFDGGGFAVKGLYFKEKDSLSYGLFGSVDNAKIQNLGVTDSFVNITKASNNTAGIIGQLFKSTVENCYNTAKVTGYYSVGGIVGASTTGSTVKNCYNTGEIQGNSYVGGIVGQNLANIQDCYNTGSIFGKSPVGGIAGSISDTKGSDNVKITLDIIRCYNTGNISSSGEFASGIVGISQLNFSEYNENRINNCISLGVSVINNSNLSDRAKRVAAGTATILNAYAREDMTVNGALVSGGTHTDSNGQNLVVSLSTAQDWSTWFGAEAASAWNFPTDGKLCFGAQLPTLKSVGGTQNPTLPERGSGSTDTYTVTGTVKDKGGNPVAGATVTLTPNAGTPNPATTGSDGKYTMNNVPNGSYTITVTLPNSGGAFTKNITVPDDISSGNFDLQQPVEQTYTVMYNGNNPTSGSVSAQTTNVGTQTTVAANGFTKTGYTFTGWNTVANGSGTAYTEGSTIPSQTAGTTVILYAQWTENTYEVSGTVKENSGSAADGAGIKLMKGNTQIGSHGVTTDSSGKFTITGVPNGIYNLVVSKDGITVTKMIVVSNGNNELTSAITLPKGKTNSIVEIKPSTPDIVVGGLDELFGSTATDNNKGFTAADKDLVETNGGTITIKLTAQRTDNTAPNANDISKVATLKTKTVGAFMDLTVSKTATDSSNKEISSQSATLVELPTLIEVRIPLAAEFQSKTGYVIYRYHGSNVDEITTTPNTEGEYFTVETDTITLHIKKFSTYAIAYTTPSTPPDNNTGGGSGGHGHSSAVSSTITAEQSQGGKITISDKTATITPNDGYLIADVMVDSKSVGSTEKYLFTDSNTHKITALFVKQIELPYYIQNGEKIYIGFSSITEKLYKYIAPHDIGVEFKENPKHFTDNTILWAKPSIDFVTEREIFLGTTQDQFSPNESMTRAMFVTVIGRLYERSYGSISGTSTFSDVNKNEYYAKYVAWANENGIIKGIGENKFAPSDQVTREQMAVIMLNFASFLKKADPGESTLTYADSTSISSWAIDGAKYCQKTKVITGRGGDSFAPQESATRAEVATVIERFIKTMLK